MNRFNEELSYKELCAEFKEEPRRGGRQRTAQMGRFNHQAVITLVPNKRGKYILERFRTKEEKDYLMATQNYSRYVENLILRMIADESPKDTFTYRQIRERLNMVNEKYFPIKYHKAALPYSKLPSNYKSANFNNDKNDWIDIADAMDEQAIRYAFDKLEEKGVIQVVKTYVLYHFGDTFTPPHYLTEEELGEMMQIPIGVLNDISEGKIDPEHNLSLLGKNLEENMLYKISPIARQVYYDRMNEYVAKKGYDRFGRAFKIAAKIDIKSVVDFVSPKFNAMQVQKYLESRRFKTIPKFIHEFLVEEMIKKEIG